MVENRVVQNHTFIISSHQRQSYLLDQNVEFQDGSVIQIGDGFGIWNEEISLPRAILCVLNFEMEPTFGDVLFSDGRRWKAAVELANFLTSFSLEGCKKAKGGN